VATVEEGIIQPYKRPSELIPHTNQMTFQKLGFQLPPVVIHFPGKQPEKPHVPMLKDAAGGGGKPRVAATTEN
jgi:hypothetical protein